MLGLGFRINELPEEPDEPLILIHKLFLPCGLLFLLFGAWGGWGYFHTKAPADRDLEEIRLRDVVKANPIQEGVRTGEVSAISLRLPNGRRVEYKRLWPRYEQVQVLDTNLSLLVDQTNQVWGLRLGDGQIAERAYFVSRNLEIKMIYGFCALFFLPSGLIGLAAFFSAERELRRGKLPESMRIWVGCRKLVLVTALFGYLGVYGLVLVPVLGRFLPGWGLALFWVITGGMLGNFLVGRLKRWRASSEKHNQTLT